MNVRTALYNLFFKGRDFCGQHRKNFASRELLKKERVGDKCLIATRLLEYQDNETWLAYR